MSRTRPVPSPRPRRGARWRWLLPVAAAVVAVMAGWLVPSEPPAGPLSDYVEGVEARAPERLERDAVPGAAVAVVVDGELVWAEGFGVADRDTEEPVTADTVFQAGSISKSVTAWAVAALAEDGRVDLDAPAEAQLDGWRLADSRHLSGEVTPRHLLAHTAGLPFAISGLPISTDQLRQWDVDEGLFALERPPGERFVYSNPGFAVLGLLLEDAGGAPLAEVMAEAVLDPLGMADSTFNLDTAVTARMATGYTADDEPVSAHWPGPVGASGLHTTAVDLARFVEVSVGDGGGALEAATLAELHRPHAETAGIPHAAMADASGLGHFLETLPGGERAVAHGGEEEGWVGGYLAVPATGDGLVVLTNSRRGYPLLIDEAAAWAAWRELDSLQLTRTRDGLAAGLRAATGLLAGAGLVLLRELLGDLAPGRRRLTPWSRARRGVRLVQLAGAALLTAAWWGVLAAPLATFLPRLVSWTGAAVALCAAMLVASAAAVPVPADQTAGTSQPDVRSGRGTGNRGAMR